MLIRFLLLGLLLLVPGTGWGAVAIDSRLQGPVSASTPQTQAFTNNNVSPLVVSTSSSGVNTVTGVTYNSVAMTNLCTITGGANASNTSLWILLSPATGANNVVVTYAGNPTAGTMFIISTSGGDTATGARTVYTRSNVGGTGGATGTGPGETVVDSQNNDIVFHAASVTAATITFDGSEVSTSTHDDAIGGGGTSGGLSTLGATGANTAVGATDVAVYSECAFSMIPDGSAPASILQQSFPIGVLLP